VEHERIWAKFDDIGLYRVPVWGAWADANATEYVHIDEYNRVVKALGEAWMLLNEEFDLCYEDLDVATPALYAHLKERDEKA